MASIPSSAAAVSPPSSASPAAAAFPATSRSSSAASPAGAGCGSPSTGAAGASPAGASAASSPGCPPGAPLSGAASPPGAAPSAGAGVISSAPGMPVPARRRRCRAGCPRPRPVPGRPGGCRSWLRRPGFPRGRRSLLEGQRPGWRAARWRGRFCVRCGLWGYVWPGRWFRGRPVSGGGDPGGAGGGDLGGGQRGPDGRCRPSAGGAGSGPGGGDARVRGAVRPVSLRGVLLPGGHYMTPFPGSPGPVIRGCFAAVWTTITPGGAAGKRFARLSRLAGWLNPVTRQNRAGKRIR
jgi:hypothetical protein